MIRSRTILAASFVSLFLAIPAFTQEKKLNKSDLPTAVQKAVDEQSQGATVRGFSTEKENGQTIYEAQLTVNGKNRDISFDPKGSVLEVEDEVAFDSLPERRKMGQRKRPERAKLQESRRSPRRASSSPTKLSFKTARRNQKSRLGQTASLWRTKNSLAITNSASTTSHQVK